MNIDFIKYRYISFALACIIVFGTLLTIALKGLNYGVDFKGGHVLEIRLQSKPDLPQLRTQLEALKVGAVSIQQIDDSTTDLMIKIEKQTDTQGDTETNIDKIKKVLGQKVEYRRVDTIGPKVGSELVQSAIKSILIALGCMLLYIAVRFQWQYALSAVIAQVHDCVAVLSLFCIFGYDFNESAIIGILITAGYSINDTIVIFDRIRENRARKSKLSIADLINVSINETLSRTLLTVLTTLLALVAMYLFGGKVIAEFSMPIILGILFGTFSSIFVAAPLLLVFGFQDKPALNPSPILQ